MAGLLDFINTPQGMGLLSAVAGGLAGARRGTPINNIGRGLVTGVAGYQGAQDQIRQDNENALTKQYKTLQMQELERQISERKGQQEWKAGLPGMMAPKLTGSTDQGKQLADQNAAFGQEGIPDLVDSAQYAQPEAPLNVNYGVDKQAVQDYMMQPNSPYAADLIKQQVMPESVVVGRTLKNKQTGETLGYDETWKDEQATARQQRIEELNIRIEDQRLNREQQIALRRELADQQASLQRESIDIRRDALAQGNKPPAGYRYTPNGDLETIPGGPADAKATAQSAASTDLDITLTGLRDSYDRLDKNYGITSTNNSTLANVGASLSSTGVGQTVGKMFGTENQSARNEIAMTRPALLSAIMRATGMSSKQLDSNAELKLWLTTATDPTLDVESNRKALNNIEMKYLKNPKAAPNSPNANGKTVSLADIQATAKSSGKTTAEVTAAFRAKGYQVK